MDNQTISPDNISLILKLLLAKHAGKIGSAQEVGEGNDMWEEALRNQGKPSVQPNRKAKATLKS